VQVIAGISPPKEGEQALIDRARMRSRSASPAARSAPHAFVAGVGVPAATGSWTRVEAEKSRPCACDSRTAHQYSGIWKRRSPRRDSPWSARLLAGTTETAAKWFLCRAVPQVLSRHGDPVGAMARGSADRYFQQDIKDTLKLGPKDIEARSV